MNTQPNHKSKSQIQGMFSEIAVSYDRTNTILSFGLHNLWKRTLINRATSLNKSGNFLDLCCGTGDILQGLLNYNRQAFGIDFAFPMLQIQKTSRNPEAAIAQADALKLPFKTQSFDVVTVAYGIRNFESLEAGIKEILRVLKPAGSLLILEFGKKPKGFLGNVIRIYENLILPTIGGLISGKANAYRYLAKSSNEFPSALELISICKGCGFKDGSFKVLSFGATYLYELQA